MPGLTAPGVRPLHDALRASEGVPTRGEGRATARLTMCVYGYPRNFEIFGILRQR